MRPRTYAAQVRAARRAIVVAALEEHDGSVPRAAKQLGVSRTNLYRLMRTLNVAIVRRVQGSLLPLTDRAKKVAAKKTAAIVVILLCVLRAAPAQAAPEVRWWYAPLIGAAVADLHSTHRALRAGAVELNPVMRHEPVRIGLKAGFTIGVIAIAEHRRRIHPTSTWVMVAIVTGVQASAAGWNYYQLAHQERR